MRKLGNLCPEAFLHVLALPCQTGVSMLKLMAGGRRDEKGKPHSPWQGPGALNSLDSCPVSKTLLKWPYVPATVARKCSVASQSCPRQLQRRRG